MFCAYMGVQMKICAAQLDIVWENKSENFRKCREVVRQAAVCGADFIIFPELSLTGFSMNTCLAEPSDGFTAKSFCELSREYAIAVAFGFACVDSGGRITNRLCVAENGVVRAEYDKLHPFSYSGDNIAQKAGDAGSVSEASVFFCGERLVTAEIAGEQMGFTICYDLRFPEIYQALSDECTVIVVSANWPEKRSVHWDTLLRARAIENQCYIIGCNRCGSGYIGGSAVFSPDGEVLCSARSYTEQLIYAEINGDYCRELRRKFPVKNDRRPELYKGFYVK